MPRTTTSWVHSAQGSRSPRSGISMLLEVEMIRWGWSSDWDWTSMMAEASVWAMPGSCWSEIPVVRASNSHGNLDSSSLVSQCPESRALEFQTLEILNYWYPHMCIPNPNKNTDCNPKLSAPSPYPTSNLKLARHREKHNTYPNRIYIDNPSTPFNLTEFWFTVITIFKKICGGHVLIMPSEAGFLCN